MDYLFIISKPKLNVFPFQKEMGLHLSWLDNLLQIDLLYLQVKHICIYVPSNVLQNINLF